MGGVYIMKEEKVDVYSKRKRKTSLNTQGLQEGDQNHSPKSVLEDRAKKKNTKIWRKQVAAIETSLLYLKESMDSYRGNSLCESVSRKLEAKSYESETEFLRELSDEEVSYLNALVRKELRYAHSSDDRTRFDQLNDIYELLY